MLAVWAHPVTHAVVMIGMVVRQFHANNARELVRRRITLLDIRAQFFVRLVLAPILRAQDVKDIVTAPVGITFWAVTVMVKFGHDLLLKLWPMPRSLMRRIRYAE